MILLDHSSISNLLPIPSIICFQPYYQSISSKKPQFNKIVLVGESNINTIKTSWNNNIDTLLFNNT